MSQPNYHQPYIKKPIAHRTKTKSRAKPPSQSKHRHTTRRPRNPHVKTRAKPDSLLQSLSSINLVSVLNSFYTVRTTVKDLRVSLEKLDSAMDSAYQMFEIAQGVMKREPTNRRRTPLRLLPPPNKTSRHGEESGEINKDRNKTTGDDEDNPFAGIFENVDIGQILAMLQSPLVQGLLKQFAQGSSSASAQTRKYTKEG